tara:strand:+ start:254 stop:676 length:423 start_codon:yes stop_codon:yes gene_type:complete
MPTIFPQFYPPHNISPLAARFILKQGNVDGTRMATIALVSLISKGLSQVQRKSRERVSGQCNSGRIGTIRVLPFGDFIGRGCIITFACLSIWGIESIGLLFANFTFYIPNLKNFTQSACKNMSVLLSLKIYIKVAEIQSL